MSKYDFHFHSTYSDGRWEIDEIIEHALSIGMKGLILSDHDNIDGQREFMKKARENGIQSSPGVEITTTFNDTELHILGYGIDIENQILNNQLIENRKAKAIRDEKLIEKLRELGFLLDDAKIEDEKLKARGSFGRLRIALIAIADIENHKLLENPTIESMFREYIGLQGKAYMKVERLSSDEAIRLIHQAGGIASLAHPGAELTDEQKFIKTADRLVSEGLDAIEVYTSKHTKEMIEIYKNYVSKNNLLITFGSDDHGVKDGPRKMGEIFVENEEEIAKQLFAKISSF